MEEPPVRVMAQIGRMVEDTVDGAVDAHERRCHAIPPPDRSPITAVPFADYQISDDQVSHAIEMLQEHDEFQVAGRMGIPLPALQRKLADYQRRHGDFIFKRSTVG